MDRIDRMIVTEVLQIRKHANESRKKLGLEPRDYTGVPVDITSLPEQNSNS